MPVRTEDVFTRTIFTFECFNWQMRRPTLVVERLRLGPPTATPTRHTLLQRKRTPQQIHPRNTIGKLAEDTRRSSPERRSHRTSSSQQTTTFWPGQSKSKSKVKANEIKTNAIDFATGPAISCLHARLRGRAKQLTE